MSKLVSQTCIFVPYYAPSILLLKLSRLNWIESEVNNKRFLLLGRLITEPKIALAVKVIRNLKTLVIGMTSDKISLNERCRNLSCQNINLLNNQTNDFLRYLTCCYCACTADLAYQISFQLNISLIKYLKSNLV